MESQERITTSSRPASASRCNVSKRATVMLAVLCSTAVLSTAMLVYAFTPEHVVESDEIRNVEQYEQQQTGGAVLEYQKTLPMGDKEANLPRIPKVTQGKRGKNSKAVDNLRLPTSLVPSHYFVRLQPFINGNFSFYGYIEIIVDVVEPTSNVTLHILDIITRNETITVKNSNDLTGPGVAITDHLYDHDRNFYTAQLGEELVVGESYYITMEFEGYLNDQLYGFYRSSYVNAEGTTVWLAATQFEPTDARRAFPCFDEPALKATFDIQIIREKTMTSISNMPLASTQPDDDENWEVDVFETSLPMSTYLVAFAVMDFSYLSNNATNDEVLFRVWARDDAIDQGQYAIGAGPAILGWYEGYYAIPFPLPKQDMIALPDFSAGAMENWGLITYRETALLYDPVLGSASNKERVAYVIAHELAHQWFGDLVTMEWWTDLWLNEGFAAYMEYLGTDSYEPTWGIRERFVTRDLQYVFGTDSLESSHPVSIPVESPDEINQIFDSISYSKGASIIRMMNNFLTEATFSVAITNYLNTHAYANANQDDLWAAMTAQAVVDGTLPAGLTVKTIMDTWTLQMGYPVINVVNNGDGTATLSQERFLLIVNPNSTDTHEYRWWVPITWVSQDNPDFSQTQASEWMSDTDVTLSISGLPTSNSWVIFNVQQGSYYRVNYDENNWLLIIDQLLSDFLVVHSSNRAQILDDSLDLARAGQLSYEISLSATSYLGNETDYVPWSAALDNLGYLESMFTRTSGYGSLKNFLLSLLTPYYDRVGFEDSLDDAHLEQLSRVLAISWTCHLSYEDCVQNSVALYSQWMMDPNNLSIISPNQKSTVYCTAIAEGAEAEWDFAWNQYLNSNLGSEKNTLLRALGCSKEIWILERYLEMAFTEGSGIRKQDSSTVFDSVASNDVGRDLAWDYLRNNVNQIAAYYNSFSAVGGLVYDATYEFNTQTQLDELIQFKEDNADSLGSATSAVDQSIERTRINIQWMTDYYDIIVTWLIENGHGRHLINRN